MPNEVTDAEARRRLAAFEASKSDIHPTGYITGAAEALGDITPSALARWLQQRGVKTHRAPKRTKAQCIQDLLALREKLGRLPSRDDWGIHSPYRFTWRTHWSGYNEFLAEAGIERAPARILILDIETAPNLAYVWGTWRQNINPEWIAANGYVLCWTAKWLGETEVTFRRLYTKKPISLLEPIHRMLSEAHGVISYNGRKFDLPTLNKEFLTHGMLAPAPYKHIDLLRTMWDTFLFPSNKLDYVAQTLGLGKKLRHTGPELWLKCMSDDPKAWKQMEEYNRQDVVLTEKLYWRLLPWIKGHPNLSAISGVAACPSCGSEEFKRDNYHMAQVFKYERYQCSACGTWFRGSKTISPRGAGSHRFRRAA